MLSTQLPAQIMNPSSIERIIEAVRALDSNDFHAAASVGSSVADVLSIGSQTLGAVDPGLDAIPFFDDSAGRLRYLVPSRDRLISGTTLNAAVAETNLINVRDLGAVGDGVTDDTAAFNAATAAVRASYVTNLGPQTQATMSIYVPPGRYSISSWDLAFLRRRAVHIIAHGAILIGNMADVPVVDMTMSMYLKVWGLTVATLTGGPVPLCGTQIGVNLLYACGINMFYGVDVDGVFSLAAHCNYGSETTGLFGCNFQNRSTSPTAYAYYADGHGLSMPTTLYVNPLDYPANVRRQINDGVSFSNNVHSACHFRNTGGGDAVFISRASGWAFERGCYYLCYNGSAIRLWQTSGNRASHLKIEGMFESANQLPTGSGNTGLRYIITLDGDGTATETEGLQLLTTSCHAQMGIINKQNAGIWKLSDTFFSVEKFWDEGPIDTLMFTGTGLNQLEYRGELKATRSDFLNLGVIGSFNGRIYTNDKTEMISAPPAGSTYMLTSAEENSQEFRGNNIFDLQEGTFLPEIRAATMGDLSVAYTVRVGSYRRIGKMVHYNIKLAFTPTYTTASGEIRIHGNTFLNNAIVRGGLQVTDINTSWDWPAGATSVMVRLAENSLLFRLVSVAPGALPVSWTTANMVSGRSYVLEASGVIGVAT